MRRYEELSAAEASSLLPRSVVVLPVGSLEQHCGGPLGADLIVAERAAEAACGELEARGVECVVAPPVAYGLSAEWSGTPGTVGLSLETFQGLVRDVVAGLVRAGARRVVVLNGHYGNSAAIEAALRGLMPALPEGAAVVQVDYWEALGLDVGHASAAEAEVLRALGVEADFGACEEAPPSPPGARVYVRPPARPRSAPAAPKGGLDGRSLARALADAIQRALSSAGSAPLP